MVTSPGADARPGVGLSWVYPSTRAAVATAPAIAYPPLAPSASGRTPRMATSSGPGARGGASAGMVRRGCARRVGWVPLVVVAVWVAALLLAGCSSSRLPDEYRTALTVTATESRRDLDTRKGRDLRRGYERTLGVVCAVLADDAAQGRGAWEWIVGLAGVTEHADVATPEACR